MYHKYCGTGVATPVPQFIATAVYPYYVCAEHLRWCNVVIMMIR